jgi:hypothetical protein
LHLPLPLHIEHLGISGSPFVWRTCALDPIALKRVLGFFLQLQPKGRSMTATISDTANQQAFYREWLMVRQTVDPREYGVDMSKDEFTDKMAERFSSQYRGHWTIDELLLHPREASLFCDDARRSLMAFDMPDDVILRVILGRRKNPGG